MKTILLLTHSLDGEHSDVVETKLVKNGNTVFRFNVDTISTGKTTVNFITNEGVFFEIHGESATLKSDEIMSVWYRRPNTYNLSIKDPQQRNFAEKEIGATLEGLWLSLGSVNWINSPGKMYGARKKVFQLKIAKDVGLKVPQTLITNNPNLVKDFFFQKRKKVIIKAVDLAYLEYASGSYYMPTTLLPESALAQIHFVTRTPVFLQEYVEKLYELRITIVGKNIFPIKIESQEFEETSIDWRNPNFIMKLRHSLVELPKSIEKRVFDLVEKMGLVFGAIDMIVTPNGDYVFLEINPSGQWYWMEDLISVPISDSICEVLVRESTTS